MLSLPRFNTPLTAVRINHSSTDNRQHPRKLGNTPQQGSDLPLLYCPLTPRRFSQDGSILQDFPVRLE